MPAVDAEMPPAENAHETIARLKNEVHAKDETLNQLKLKTKSFVDTLRRELETEKHKVAELESERVRLTKEHGSSLKQDGMPRSVEEAGPTPAQPDESEVVAALKREIAVVTQREHDLRVRAKSFADGMKQQLQAEKAKTNAMEAELRERSAALAAAATLSTSSSEEDEKQATTVAALVQVEAELKVAQQEVQDLRKALSDAEQDSKFCREEELRARQALEEMQKVKEAAGSAEMEKILQSTQQEIATLRDALAEAKQAEQLSQDQESHARHALEAMQAAQQASQADDDSAKGQLQRELDTAITRQVDLSNQLQQHKIENDLLQKKLQDRDFQLEQWDADRQRADAAEEKVTAARTEITSLNQQITELEKKRCALQDEIDKPKTCGTCSELQHELREMSALYEKVNMGRSQSDHQLAEAQAAISDLQDVKKSYEESLIKLESMTKEISRSTETIRQRDSELTVAKEEVKRLSASESNLTQMLTTYKKQAEELDAENATCSTTARELQTRITTLEAKNQALTANVEAVTKDSNEKRQKAKSLVIALTQEKQTLADSKAEAQKEVDRLRMELNQMNIENERRLKKLQEETQQRVQQSTHQQQSLTDEIGTLKQTLLMLQESERSQQRARELASAKREVEDSNKKRLAAKAETQKLAVELENLHKSLHLLAENSSTSCTVSVRKIGDLHDRVVEALQVLEKRAAASKTKSASDGDVAVVGHQTEEQDTESISREGASSPTVGIRKVEDSIIRLNEKLNALMEQTSQLCDLSMEQNDISIKDIFITKASQLFTNCFSEKLRAAYAKVDEGESSLLGTKT